jgi:hypothetical protein
VGGIEKIKRMLVCLKDHQEKKLFKPVLKLDNTFKETEELVALVAKSIDTASENKRSKNSDS